MLDDNLLIYFSSAILIPSSEAFFIPYIRFFNIFVVIYTIMMAYWFQLHSHNKYLNYIGILPLAALEYNSSALLKSFSVPIPFSKQ